MSAEDAPRPIKPGVPLTKGMFRGAGFVVLVVLWALPVWDAIAMLENFNYLFWGSTTQPIAVMVSSVSMLLLLFVAIEAFFARGKAQTTQSLVMMASVFVTLLGVVLILISLPLWSRAIEARNQIMYQCDSSPQTHELWTYYMQLLNVRQGSDCAASYSVETCAGYVNEPRLSNYLKNLETHFRCSGFCYHAGQTRLNSQAATVSATAGDVNATQGISAALLDLDSAYARRHRKSALGAKGGALVGALVAAELGSERSESRQPTAAAFPPTLFSDANFRVSCDGAAARNMAGFARDTAYQMWYMGIALVAISITMGLFEWSSLVSA